MASTIKIEALRAEIDYAIDAWLKANGVSEATMGNLDYSFIDDELNDLLTAVED